MAKDSTRRHNPPDTAVAPPVAGGADGGEPRPPHDAVGAYVLGALPADERRAFERHLPGCADCRREVAELRPVAALLPLLLEIESEESDATAAIPPPSPALRDRVLAAARAEEAAGVGAVLLAEDESLGRDAPVVTPVPTRPRGRIRPGVTVGGGTAADGAVVVRPLWGAARAQPGWLAAAVLALLAVGSLTWALILQGRLDDRQDEIRAQRESLQAQEQLIAQIRSQANATAFTLAPTAEGPPAATGSLLFSLRDRAGVLHVKGLPPLPADQAYQLWYIDESGPHAGQTFPVNEQGEAIVPIGIDVQPFDGIGLTAEPRSGSPLPTTPVVMSGTLGGAAG